MTSDQIKTLKPVEITASARYVDRQVCLLKPLEYVDGSLALMLFNTEHLPIIKVTVNLNQTHKGVLGEGEFFIPLWGQYAGLADDLISTGVVKSDGVEVPTGHSASRVCRLSEKTLNRMQAA